MVDFAMADDGDGDDGDDGDGDDGDGGDDDGAGDDDDGDGGIDGDVVVVVVVVCCSNFCKQLTNESVVKVCSSVSGDATSGYWLYMRGYTALSSASVLVLNKSFKLH